MSSELATQQTDPQSSRPPAGRRHVRVLSENLRMGMFVAELDRPWSDTPFLIQGFAIGSTIELETMRRHCRHVFVDLERSSPETADLLRAIGPADPPTGSFEDTASRGHDAADTHTMPGREWETGIRADDEGSADTGIGAPREADAGCETPYHDTATGRWPDTAQRSAPPDHHGTASDHAGAGPSASAGQRRANTRTYQARADVAITRDTRRRFRALVRSARPLPEEGEDPSMAGRALKRLKSLFGSADDEAGAHDERREKALAALRAELAALLAPGERLRHRPARHGMSDELPRARHALKRGERALAALTEELRAGQQARADRVEVAANHMADSMADNPDALMWVAQLRSEPLLPHQQGARVGLYMIALARWLGLPRELMAQAGMVGMLADVGKARLPRALLEKPGMLNASEYGIVKEHVRLGMELLALPEGLSPEVARGIAQHHERLDGSGYPCGLKRSEISVFGRMAAIVDSYAALTMPRAYASPLAPQDALMNLYQWRDTSFDAMLVEQFVQAIGVFPVGSLVELSGGEIAVVCERNEGHPLQPRVRLLTWPDRRPLPVALEIDLLQPEGPASRGPAAQGAVPGRILRGLPAGAYGLRPADPDAAEADAR